MLPFGSAAGEIAPSWQQRVPQLFPLLRSQWESWPLCSETLNFCSGRKREGTVTRILQNWCDSLSLSLMCVSVFWGGEVWTQDLTGALYVRIQPQRQSLKRNLSMQWRSSFRWRQSGIEGNIWSCAVLDAKEKMRIRKTLFKILSSAFLLIGPSSALGFLHVNLLLRCAWAMWAKNYRFLISFFWCFIWYVVCLRRVGGGQEG